MSDSVGLFFFRKVRWWKLEVKIRTGTRSNRWPEMAKNSRVTTMRPVLRHWCQVSRIRGCGMVLNSTGHNRFYHGRSPAKWFHFESLTWPCMIASWHHWCCKCSRRPFYRCLFGRRPIRISTFSDLRHRILRKNLSDQSLWLLVHFSFNKDLFGIFAYWMRPLRKLVKLPYCYLSYMSMPWISVEPAKIPLRRLRDPPT